MLPYNIGSVLGWFGAPVLLPAAVSVVYFWQSPPVQSLRDRLLISAHGVLISVSYLGAMFVGARHASSELLAAPFVLLLVLAIALMQLAIRRFRGPRRVHLLQIVNVVCLGWTFFIGGMVITGEGL